VRLEHGFENNYFTEMCSGSEAGSYLRLIDFVYSILGLRVIKKRRKKKHGAGNSEGLRQRASHPSPYTRHLTPCTLHPTPYTPHPTPYTLHPTPYTLNPTPYTPTPYTLHPTLCTLHPTPYALQTFNPARVWGLGFGVWDLGFGF